MNNADYWAQRIKRMEDALKDESYEYVENIERQYDAATANLDTQIRAWYQRFADNNGGITYAEAQKLLTTSELEEFKWTVQDYIRYGKEHAISGAWAKELENASARVHISRLESLKIRLRQQAEALTQASVDATTEAARRAYTESYYHTAFEVQRGLGVGWTMQGIDEKRLEKVLSRPWTADGRTFTARCWTDKTKLVETVNQELTRMIAVGEAPDKAIAAIAKQFGVSKSNAGRVVMTESAYFASAAQKDCFEELDVEKYRVVAALDRSTCGTCGAMDGTVFKMSEYEVGATAPPFHPWCRCCTAPYFEDMEEVARKEDFPLSKNATFDDWETLQKQNKPDEKDDADAVDKSRKMEYNETADRAEFERYKAVLGELLPDDFEDFQQIKYYDSKKWAKAKSQYRILNSYKIDSGVLSPPDILRLDDLVITEKRTQFTSDFKKSGNIAGAYLDGDISKMYFAHSSLSENSKGYKGKNNLVLLKDSRRFKYIDVPKSSGEIRTNTYLDTEAKLFEYFADLYEKEPFQSITMLSERGMCDSCKGVMEQFKKLYPDVKVNVVSNKQTEGNVWKNRRK